jgi:uncharacterized protein YyaL (SSP411 family)
MPGFPRVLLSVAQAYREKRSDIDQSAGQIREFLDRQARQQHAVEALSPRLLDAAFSGLLTQFDSRHGGFGSAPKFPQPMLLEFLLRTGLRTRDPRALSMVEITLERMARGGLYDQLGGGFHRYSVDAQWLVPHFEKMLYDNSQLAALYLHAFQVTDNPAYRRVVEETLDYVLREMTAPEGGFYSTQDADSEGEEGKFFVWTPDEVREVLGEDDARIAMAYYQITPGGNFEGHTILWAPRPDDEVAAALGIALDDLHATLDRARPKLFAARERRVKPGRDDKVLTSWNGLMLRAFAEAAAALGRDDYHRAAEANAEFVLGTLRREGRLLRTYKDGRAHLNAFLEDYSFYADGLLALYQATLDPRWYREARALADAMLDLFWDPAEQTFFDTARDHEQLVSRPRDVYDNATPSGTSVAADVLLRLASLADQPRYREHAEQVLRSLGEAAARVPTGFGRLLSALDFALATSQEVAIVGDPGAPDTAALLSVVRERYRPNTVLALTTGPGDALAAELPLLADRPRRDGQATAYVCEHYACQMPTTDPEELRRQLAESDTR